jgi:uncharacterized protein YjbJ (UPF0337 family)
MEILADVAIWSFLKVSSEFQPPGSRARAKILVVSLDWARRRRERPVRRVTPPGLAGPLTEIYITSKATMRNQMDQSTQDEIKGNIHEAKGAVKEKAGRVTNNPNLTAEGKNEKLAGKVQKTVGQIEKVLER